MPDDIIEDHIYEGMDFRRSPLSPGVYDGCSFVGCVFRGTHLIATSSPAMSPRTSPMTSPMTSSVASSVASSVTSSMTFRACVFRNCDCSLMDVDGTSFQDTLFQGCRLEGVQFARCRRLLLSFSFDRCMLRLASFASLDIRGTRFDGCELYEADFSESDLRGAVFADCDLLRAIFMHTNLEKADFRTARNYSFSPDLNRIRNARFCLPELTGLLEGYGIRIE